MTSLFILKHSLCHIPPCGSMSIISKSPHIGLVSRIIRCLGSLLLYVLKVTKSLDSISTKGTNQAWEIEHYCTKLCLTLPGQFYYDSTSKLSKHDLCIWPLKAVSVSSISGSPRSRLFLPVWSLLRTLGWKTALLSFLGMNQGMKNFPVLPRMAEVPTPISQLAISCFYLGGKSIFWENVYVTWRPIGVKMRRLWSDPGDASALDKYVILTWNSRPIFTQFLRTPAYTHRVSGKLEIEK